MGTNHGVSRTLRKDAIGLFGIVFFVTATNGLLTALVGSRLA